MKTPRFIPVTHATLNLYGVADLKQGAVARYFLKACRDVVLDILQFNEEHLVNLDSAQWLTASKNWVCDDAAMQFAYDEMLARAPFARLA